MAPQFEHGFLEDEFGVRAELAIPDLPVTTGTGARDDSTVEAAAFSAWHARTATTLAAAASALPALYQVWVHRPDGQGKTGRAAYFEAGGEDYAVFASSTPELVAHKLPPGWLREKLLPAQRQSTGYAQAVIPRVEDRLPGAALPPADGEGNLAISARGFEDVFAGSDVELEAWPFTAVFARELRELAGAAAHAATCGRPLHLRHA